MCAVYIYACTCVMYAHVHVHVCMCPMYTCVQVHLPLCKCVEARDGCWMPVSFSTLLLRQGLPLSLEFTASSRLTGQLVSSVYLHPLGAGIKDITSCSAFV